MDQGPHRSWPPQQGANAHGEQQGQNQQNQVQAQAPRQGTTFGSGTPQQHHSPPSAPSGLPAQGAPFPAFHQPAHSLASLAGISQASPRQPVPPPHRADGQNQAQQVQGQPPPPSQAFALPGISQATGQADRERERAREADHIHIKEEEDRRHRERMDQAPQHQSQSGPPPHLHQPVAVGPRSAHGPNGLLSNPGLGGQPQPSHLPLGAPSGPANIFAGGPVQPAQGQQMQPTMLAPYNLGAPATQPAPQQQQQQQQQQQNMGSSQGQGQGQQPILNDALSYLDQVKVQFADHPDVYNRFLDIMKDFKSGAIDTPGVIGRVSTLFAGNPQLIQGFNTFLPPGYRIECGADDDPNAIRVTTPMGTTVQSMPQPRPLSRQDRPEGGSRPANGTFTPQPGVQGSQIMFSPSTSRAMGPAAPGQPQHLSPQEQARQQQEQQAMHQQEQRGVNSLQSAVSAAASGAGAHSISPRATPLPGQIIDSLAADAPSQPGMEKRGPVEFNHAISYVNKIKNRFSAHPDIYKQFLEILQTYQRESKPIQDVYSQVTFLFKTAPDLLEDFKQFLPESAAQAKAAERARQEAEANVMTSNMREAGRYGSPVASREQPTGTPGHGQRMPPVGNFAPTPASKDVKRKRPGENRVQDGSINGTGSSKAQPFQGQAAKRQKHNQPTAKALADQPPVSPTLIPDLPAPILPTTGSAATSDELSFFDKAKKAIGNKVVMGEFLKLCNLYSQDLVDRTFLVHRANAFIGGNPELMKYFREWLGYDEREILVENKARVPSGRVMLSNCRGHGPSYRLLPKRERQKPCSGRDELCNSVLNDEWASHPTWASEDSGFIAHRKNIHEEGLHRIEEERHDYDYNIEACSRTIQLLEPIATQLRRMDDQSQRQYTLPPGLGGQSETIYKRVIMKLYGRERGAEVIESLIARPYQVIPVLLNRLKERLESWKMAQREWEKVWREQTQKMFWKSLDHQAVTAKQTDRRQFQLKTLQSEIQVKYEEMKRASHLNPAILLKPQMEFTIDDPDVLLDATYLLLSHVDSTLATDHPKLFGFIRDFVPLFFGLDAETFRSQINSKFDHSPNNELADDDASGGEDSASNKSRKGGAVKNANLLRTALIGGRGRTPRKDREDSNASGSRASSPDGGLSNAGGEEPAAGSTEDLEAQEELAAGRWLEHPLTGNPSAANANVNPLEPQQRSLYRFWANTPIYCWLRLFVMLYERLSKLKHAESTVRENVKNAKRVKPAVELGIVDKLPEDFFPDTSGTAHYYSQMLQKFDEVLKGELDFAEVEEALRRFYLQSGYPLYPFEKIVSTAARNAVSVMNSDSKEKSAEIYQLFKKDRVREMFTAQQQTDYRKSVDKMIKDGETYRIDFDQLTNKIRIFLAKKEDPIGDDGLSVHDRETRWRYYIASYTSVDNTEGIDINNISYPFLMSNIKAYGADPRSETFPLAAADFFRNGIVEKSRFLDVKNEEKLSLRISVNNFKAFFQAGTCETWLSTLEERTNGEVGIEQAIEVAGYRDDVMKSSFIEKPHEEDADARFSKVVQGDSNAADDRMDTE